jgi:hypothetical protein
LVGVDFIGNQAGYGGGMRNYYHNGSTWIWMINVIFVGNMATYDGGAIYNDEANASILNGNIVSNIAGDAGGGIYSTWLSDAYAYNSILWGNQATSDPQAYTSANSTTTIEYSLVQDGCPDDAVCTPSPLTDNPDFIRDPEDGADNVWGGLDDDYGDMRLQMSSPAIDAGDVDAVTGFTTMYTVYSDYADNPRRIDVTSVPNSGHGSAPVVDIGAYEHPPEVIYVDHTATGGANSGLSWADALDSLKTALRWGNSGAAQVWVAEGAYKPGSHRSAAFQLVNNLEIFGGFPAGGGDGSFGARDPGYYQTILSGDIGVQSDSSDNCYHVVDASGVDETAKLDGVAIRYGHGDGDEYRFRYGGGVYNWGGSPALNNVKIENNYADYGGGMHNREGDPKIQNSMIQENEATRGAGMHNRVSDYVMSGTSVQDNVASSGEGGGIYNDASNPTISGSFLIGNHAKYGGGMYNEDGSSPEIDTTQFLDNIANSSGGGMYNLESSPSMKYALFQRNYAQLGGAVYSDESELTVVNGIFYGNGAKSDCGAVLNDSNGYLHLVNSVLSGNYASVVGGICNHAYSVAVLSNSTISGNYSSSGSSSGFGNRDHSSATLVNSIIWGNELGDLANIDADCDANISYSILPSCPSFTICSNLITDDPLFVRTPDPGLDSVWGTTDDDYGDLRLLSSSVGVDAGDNDRVPKDSLDLDGDDDTGEKTPLDLNDAPRFVDVGLASDTGHGSAPIVDIGAYEVFNYVYLPLVVRH